MSLMKVVVGIKEPKAPKASTSNKKQQHLHLQLQEKCYVPICEP
jgi:hypothetical protein